MDTFPSVIPSAPLEAAGEFEPGRMGSTQGVVPIWTPHTRYACTLKCISIHMYPLLYPLCTIHHHTWSVWDIDCGQRKLGKCSARLRKLNSIAARFNLQRDNDMYKLVNLLMSHSSALCITYPSSTPWNCHRTAEKRSPLPRLGCVDR